MQANKHVLCEARMAMNASEAKEMLETSRKYPHLVAQIVPAPLTLRFDNTIRKMLANKTLGELLTIDVRSSGFGNKPNWFDGDAPLTWRQDVDSCKLILKK